MSIHLSTLHTDRERRTIDRIRHPDYTLRYHDWELYRRTFDGGSDFVHHYLKKFSSRETHKDFCRRKEISYCPAHAKAAIIDVRNAIYQRMVDISRKGGPASYNTSVLGVEGGVDLRGNTMDGFIGRIVLPELLVLGRVGVYIDKDPMPDMPNLAQTAGLRPYLYYYRAEDILSWQLDRNNQLTVLLLRDHHITVDENTGLPDGEGESFRLLRMTDRGVVVEIHKSMTSDVIRGSRTVTIEKTSETRLDIPRIPFVFFDIGQSLLKDVAGYQIALLNLASSDLNYALKSNFPFYTEQYNPNTQSLYLKRGNNASIADTITEDCASTPCKEDECKPPSTEISTGVSEGRAYPTGTERPAFIHPSSEPLKASMEKQEQLKTEIRQLVNLAITNIKPQRASAESKEKDDRGLEAGLSYIGLELEHGEREIGKIWALYEGGEAPTVKYPDSYSLRSDDDRRREAKELRELMAMLPSKRYQKTLAKDIARITVGNTITNEELVEINDEIESAPVVVTDPEVVRLDHEAGFVSTETASKIRGYPAGEVDQAKIDHAERLERIQMAQSAAPNPGARGLRDMSADPGLEARLERAQSMQTDEEETTEDRSRGRGRNNDES
jgi:hypothetical protein